jgi:hypothetical protein
VLGQAKPKRRDETKQHQPVRIRDHNHDSGKDARLRWIRWTRRSGLIRDDYEPSLDFLHIDTPYTIRVGDLFNLIYSLHTIYSSHFSLFSSYHITIVTSLSIYFRPSYLLPQVDSSGVEISGAEVIAGTFQSNRRAGIKADVNLILLGHSIRC